MARPAPPGEDLPAPTPGFAPEASAPDVAAGDDRTRARRAAWTVVALGILSALLAVVAARVLYPMYSPDLDDVVYATQGRLLATGHLTLPAADATFFQPYLTGIHGDRIVFIYTPMWAGVLAASHLAFGTTLAALPAVAAAGVAAMYAFARELFRDRDRLVPLLATALFALSPMAVLLSGTYLSYHVGAVIALVAGWLLLRGLRTGSAWSYAGAGAAFGVAFLGRPFDAILLAVPFAVYAWWLHRRRLGVLAAPVGLLVVGALPLLVLTAILNAHLMGSPLSFPQNVAGDYNRFGFGPRMGFAYQPSDLGEQDVFTFGRSLHALWVSLIQSPRWILGSVVSVLAAGYAVVRGWRDARTWLLVAVVAAFPIGYLFWWGSYNAAVIYEITRQLGPFYYHPSLAPLALLAAWGAVLVARGRRVWTVGAVALTGVALAAAGMVEPLRDTRSLRDERRGQEAMVLDSVPRRDALVFLPGDWLLVPFPTLGYPVDASPGPRLFALDRDAANLELMDRHPDREAWVVRSAFPATANIFESREVFSVWPSPPRRTATLHRSGRLRVETLQPYAAAYVRAGSYVRSVVLPPGAGGAHRFEVTVTAPPARSRHAGAEGSAEIGPDGVVRLHLTVPEARHASVAFGVGFGPSADLHLATLSEYRYSYRTHGDGTMTVIDLPRPYRRVVFPGHDPTWISQEVDDVVRLDSARPRGRGSPTRGPAPSGR